MSTHVSHLGDPSAFHLYGLGLPEPARRESLREARLAGNVHKDRAGDDAPLTHRA